MTWKEKQLIISRLGLVNFTSEEEFENWRQWENDDLQLEKKIKNALHIADKLPTFNWHRTYFKTNKIKEHGYYSN